MQKHKIAFIGKFKKLHDEEYIARSLESLGHEVLRLPDNMGLQAMLNRIKDWKPAIVLMTKFQTVEDGFKFMKTLKQMEITTVCWVFDLYWGYPREYRIRTSACFRADYVFSTDNGHQQQWEQARINHQCVRQGIFDEECYLEPLNNPHGLVFVGSENPLYLERSAQIQKLQKDYMDFRWYGRSNTDHVRGTDLNKLYAMTKIVIGDSVYSSHYWSNRVVETLGRGGFLVHHEVEGIKDVYPDLVTYKRNDYADLKAKIDYYMTHERERQEIIKANFEHVKAHYTMRKMCEEVLSRI